MPWVRPGMGVSMNSTARAFSTDTKASDASMSRSAARVRVAHRAVSTTSDDVRP
jgi:hypothetical protein